MADGIHDDGREIWDVTPPPGGWGQPWPQCIELARNLPAQHWTLVGGLMGFRGSDKRDHWGGY